MNIRSYQPVHLILAIIIILLLSSCKNSETSADPFRDNSGKHLTVIRHTDYRKEISLSIQVSDRRTGVPIKNVNVAVNSKDNVIGKTDDDGVYKGDTTVPWGLAVKPGQQVSIDDSPETNIFLTHDNYRDSAILEYKPNVTEIEKKVTLEVKKINPDDEEGYVIIYHDGGGMSLTGGSIRKGPFYYFDDNGDLKMRQDM